MRLGKEYLSKDDGTWSPDLPLIKIVLRSPDLSQNIGSHLFLQKPRFQSYGRNFKQI